jgi:hypothetical protein
MRVNAAAVAAGALGVLLVSARHPHHPAQVVVALAAGGAFLAALSRGREVALADWLTVRLLLAGNLVVFGVSNAHHLSDPLAALSVLCGVVLAAAATVLHLRRQGERKSDR